MSQEKQVSKCKYLGMMKDYSTVWSQGKLLERLAEVSSTTNCQCTQKEVIANFKCEQSTPPRIKPEKYFPSTQQPRIRSLSPTAHRHPLSQPYFTIKVKDALGRERSSQTVSLPSTFADVLDSQLVHKRRLEQLQERRSGQSTEWSQNAVASQVGEQRKRVHFEVRGKGQEEASTKKSLTVSEKESKKGAEVEEEGKEMKMRPLVSTVSKKFSQPSIVSSKDQAMFLSQVLRKLQDDRRRTLQEYEQFSKANKDDEDELFREDSDYERREWASSRESSKESGVLDKKKLYLKFLQQSTKKRAYKSPEVEGKNVVTFKLFTDREVGLVGSLLEDNLHHTDYDEDCRTDSDMLQHTRQRCARDLLDVQRLVEMGEPLEKYSNNCREYRRLIRKKI